MIGKIPKKAIRRMPMRVRYYDYLKALAMFLVLSFHQVWIKGDVPASISMAFVPMAVPLFFMVHGALVFPRETTPKKQVNRFLKVLMQLYVWNTVYLLLSVATGLTEPTEITGEFLFQYYFCKLDSSGITSGHLWFIYALLVLYALYPVLETCKKHNEKVFQYIMIACFFLSFIREEILVYLDFFRRMVFGKPLVTEWLWSRVGPYFNAVFYFIFGYYLSQWAADFRKQGKDRKKVIVLSLLGIILGLGMLLIERYVVFGSFNYNWKPLPDQYEKLGTLVMCTSTFVLFSLLDLEKARSYPIAKAISFHSLDIFYIHVIFARLARVYLYQNHLAGVWQNYLRALIILILSLGCGWLLRRIPLVKKLM